MAYDLLFRCQAKIKAEGHRNRLCFNLRGSKVAAESADRKGGEKWLKHTGFLSERCVPNAVESIPRIRKNAITKNVAIVSLSKSIPSQFTRSPQKMASDYACRRKGEHLEIYQSALLPT